MTKQTDNSFLHPLGEIHFDRYQPQDAAAALDHTLAETKHSLQLIKDKLDSPKTSPHPNDTSTNLEAVLSDGDVPVGTSTAEKQVIGGDSELGEVGILGESSVPVADRTYDNTLHALANAEESFQMVCSLISHLESELGEPWREAMRYATELSSTLMSVIQLDQDIYRALSVLRDGAVHATGTTAQQKLLADTLREFELAGVALAPEAGARIEAINVELAQLRQQFGEQRVIASDKAGLLVKDSDQLAGLDDEFIAQCHEAAQQRGDDGYWLQYNEPNSLMIMSRCAVRATREAFYREALSRSGYITPNLSRASRILKLRYEKAALLSYPTYADYALVRRMAQTAASARDFVGRLIEAYSPTAQQERSALQDFARKFDSDPTLELYAGDLDADGYYALAQRQSLFDIDEASLREYFELTTVIDGMFDVLGEIYGVTFHEAMDVATWHSDVRVYDIHDEQGRHIARVWCDWFARPGKRSGAWMDMFYVADRKAGAVERPHLGHVNANLMQPTATMPCLLSIRNVETVWHEFGHFMHAALGGPELREQSMMSCKWDFIEAPSQIMENWVTRPEVVAKIARHYKTGEPLPVDQIEKLKRSQRFMVGVKTIRQLVLAEIDLALHMDFADTLESTDILEVARTIKGQLCGVPIGEYDMLLLVFGHIFDGDYSAGYYSYKWAEAIEVDLFSRFAEEGVLNPQTGDDYRRKVLQPGAEREPAELIRDFLGRDSTIDAMLTRDGLTPRG